MTPPDRDLLCAEGSLMLQLLREWSVERLLPDAVAHPGLARLRDGTRQHLGMVDEALRASPHPAGPDFTAADIVMAYPSTTVHREIRPLGLAPDPSIETWVGHVEARPAVRQGRTAHRAVVVRFIGSRCEFSLSTHGRVS